MEAPERGALMLVRFVAVALISLTAIDLALYWAVCSHNHIPLKLLPCLSKSIPLILGVVALIKAKWLAAWISNILDD